MQKMHKKKHNAALLNIFLFIMGQMTIMCNVKGVAHGDKPTVSIFQLIVYVLRPITLLF